MFQMLYRRNYTLMLYCFPVVRRRTELKVNVHVYMDQNCVK